MKNLDPKLIVRQFNDCINNKDLVGLTKLMTDDHTFIDRDGTETKTKKVMTQNWRKFFDMVPDYKNTFTKIESTNDMVIIIGYAFWSKDQPLAKNFTEGLKHVWSVQYPGIFSIL